MVEKNERGEILLNVEEVAKKTIDGFSRYNGGWIKKVVGFDKTKTNGYSILGDFIGKSTTWVRPGALFIDCSKDGSRKNQVWIYTLFRIKEDGTGEELPLDEAGTKWIRCDGPGGDWAVKFWPAIEKGLKEQEEKYPAGQSISALLEERKRLIARIREINAVIGENNVDHEMV